MNQYIIVAVWCISIIAATVYSEENTYVLEEALVQNGKKQLIESTEEYHIYRIAPEPKKGFHWPYLLLVGEGIGPTTEVMLFVETVNTGCLSDSYRFHEETALSSLRALFHRFADFKDRVIFMMPVFIRPVNDWKLYTHALDRDCLITDHEKLGRIDLQLIAMFKDACVFLENEKALQVHDTFGIAGFSASGEFAQRFSILHPEQVAFVVAGGIGGLPVLPIKEKDGCHLRYPVGISDFEALMGEEFNVEVFNQLPRFLYFGSEDSNDPVKFDDAYDELDRECIYQVLGENAVDRWIICMDIYDQLGTQTETYLDEGMGHKTSVDMFIKINDFVARCITSCVEQSSHPNQ